MTYTKRKQKEKRSVKLNRSALLASTAVAFAQFAGGGAIAQNDGDANAAKEYNIPPSTMSEALQAYSEQADVEILFAEKDVEKKTSNGVEGEYSQDEALDEIIEDSGLKYEVNDDGVIVIRTALLDVRRTPLRVAQVEQSDTRAVQPIDTKSNIPSDEGEESKRDEIIVTGTNIRGSGNNASPVLVFDRETILRTGSTTTQDFIRTIPQNLDFSETTAGGFAGPTSGFGGASAGVNIRGLGAGATLTLVNGRRLAFGGGSGEFVDISLLPLTAIEQVEIVTDGASAIYGADAVAGVVNFIIRDDYDGAETRFKFGGVTSGSSQQYQAGQTVGKVWSSGSFLASYEYFQRNNLDANDRSFTEGAADPTDLLPGQERHSVLVNSRQIVSENVELFGIGTFSASESELNLSNIFGAGSEATDIKQFGGNIGAEINLIDDWRVEVAGGFSSNESDIVSLLNGALDFRADSKFDLWSVDLIADGSLFALPGGGHARIAIGGQFRREEFNRTTISLFSTEIVDLNREVYAFFGELLLPIVSEGNQRPGIRSLDITLAGRYEDFSDFGSSANPKVGINYVPHEDVAFRGTYGTSFQAPRFFDLGLAQRSSPVPGFIFAAPPGAIVPLPDVLLLQGGNPNLEPEEARTWTGGLDYTPSFLPELELAFTYFDIKFDGRIDTPAASIFDVFVNPDAFGDAAIFEPDASQIGNAISNSLFTDPFGIGSTNIGAIVDIRLQNLTSTRVRGFDATLNYSTETPFGALFFRFNGSYLFEFLNRTSSSVDAIDLVDTTFNPVDWRFRTSATWQKDGYGAAVFLNYVDNYQSSITGVDVPVNSWTTIDLNFSYDTNFHFRGGVLDNTRLSFNVQNLLNEAPPFVDIGFGLGVNFDGTNANALGRFISLTLTKAW